MPAVPVRIVTDSSAHFLNPNAMRDFGIEVLPLEIQLGGVTYREGKDIDSEQYFRKLQSYTGSELPSLLPPSVEKITELYARLCGEGSPVISLHLSRAIHPMFHQAQLARQELLGRCDIEVVDSQTTSVMLGIMVEEAARMAQQGSPAAEIIRFVRSLVPRLYTMFYAETLSYLQRGGLLSESQTVLGAMLGIKPFLTIEDGDLQAVEKVRTRAQAIDKLVEFAAEFENVERSCILYSSNIPPETLRSLTDRLEEEIGAGSYPVQLYQPSLASLIGPDSLGIVVYERLDEDFGKLGDSYIDDSES
ncbi:MAG: DegV family protein [Anaerolineae bacterium]|nr:DegV family protein [Anaerolineae bacterium]